MANIITSAAIFAACIQLAAATPKTCSSDQDGLIVSGNTCQFVACLGGTFTEMKSDTSSKRKCVQFGKMKSKQSCTVDNTGKLVQAAMNQRLLQKGRKLTLQRIKTWIASKLRSRGFNEYPHGTVIMYSKFSSFICLDGKKALYRDPRKINTSNRVVFTMVRFG